MVLVTGANGLIGSFICKTLLKNGFKVRALVRESSDLRLLKDIKEEIDWVEADVFDLLKLEQAMQDVEIIIHSAAMISIHKRDHEVMLKTNVEGTANIVNLASRLGIKKIVHVSSVAALGRTKNVETIDENNKWENSSYNTGYAISKYLAELEVWRAQEEGLNVVVINPSVVLGPGDWDRSSTKLFKYVWDNKRFYAKGAMNYVDVRDVAEVVRRLIEADISGERFILSAGNISYKDIFALIAQRFGRRAPSIAANKFLSNLVVFYSQVKSFFTGDKPLVSRESANMAGLSFYYDSRKLQNTLNFRFRSLEDTLDWTCQSLQAET
ncbi:SDR family NAD(P)-dependent oxidoreductase [Fulvivirgaceae bacterium BMA12]|uniref:SDR family NAD(P)-dependent oxidoreductase n=1 Tax=Agaribacillus aureus TaxID=3051825 RepID=A0ABT8LH27_9BACT|nr:SDR family NAD(P)-dependent oxidoreductase [Fulvivirgaceae bacterium BMA12]